MVRNAEPVTPIKPEAYTDEYYRTAVEGHQEFAASGGRRISARMVRALELADPRPGQRLLDIGCGRGEIVLQGAMRGAYAVGIDYAQAAMAAPVQSLDRSDELRIGLARMDATGLALQDETFDVAFMLDFVEHVHQADLEAAMREVARTLKPGGRLIIHTSPNRVCEDVVYRYYVRNVHRVVLGLVQLLRLDKGRLLNSTLLPTDPLPPHGEYERQFHINPQSAGSLRAALKRSGFRVRRIDHWEPPKKPFFPPDLRWHNIGLAALDFVRFLRPFSRLPPLSQLFCNHIWAVAERT